MYELIILSLLSQRSLHGYLIAKIINDIIGPYGRLSNGRLYPLLAKLEADGLITTTETAPQRLGARRQRAYTITEAGRERQRELMLDTTSNQGEYQRYFWLKVPSLYLLAPHEQLYLLDHYITYCQTHIFHLTAEIEDMRRRRDEYMPDAPERHAATIFMMEHMQDQWRLEVEAAQRWRAHVLATAEDRPTVGNSHGAVDEQRAPAPLAGAPPPITTPTTTDATSRGDLSL